MKLSPQEMTSLQNQLLREASYLTRTLYRKCLQSINLLAQGNTRDEDDFSARETQEKNQFDVDFDNNDGANVDLSSSRISMAPPVNRTNELSSRANYYATYARENFDGHWNLLGAHGFHIGDEGNMTHGLGGLVHFGGGLNDGNNQQERNRYQGGHHHLGGQMAAQQYRGSGGENGDGSNKQQQQQQGDVQYYMWREEQIEQFIYLIKSGEEKRQWILNDYEFEDPFNSPKRSDGVDDNDDDDSARCQGWPHELEHRLKKFEEESDLLVKAMYRGKGWMHSSDYEHLAKEDDGFFSDSDSDEDQ